MPQVEVKYTTQPGAGWAEDLSSGWYAFLDGIGIAQPIGGWASQADAIKAANDAAAPGALALGDFRIAAAQGKLGNVDINTGSMSAYFDYLLNPSKYADMKAAPEAVSSAANMAVVNRVAAEQHRSDTNYSNGLPIGLALIGGIGAIGGALAATTAEAVAVNALDELTGAGILSPATIAENAARGTTLTAGGAAIAGSGAATAATLTASIGSSSVPTAASFDIASGLAEDAGMTQSTFEATNLAKGLTASGAVPGIVLGDVVNAARIATTGATLSATDAATIAKVVGTVAGATAALTGTGSSSTSTPTINATPTSSAASSWSLTTIVLISAGALGVLYLLGHHRKGKK